MIEVEGLSKTFRDFWRRPKVRAVQDLSFRVMPGEALGLLGPNGSGKSTTIKILLGLLRPSRGRVRVAGKSSADVRAKSRIGYLPEESYLYPHLTAEETLDFYGRLFGLGAAERRRRIADLLEMTGLSHVRRRMVGEFSKGMARRVGLAQALINDPALLLLDEPTSGLDPIGCRQMKDLLLTLMQRGKTLVLSSHLLADVEDVCDRILILYNGRVQAHGPIRELLEIREQTRVWLPSDLSPEALRRVLAAAREEVGHEPEVDHPRRDLEQFFLEVVRRAREEAPAPSGADGGHAVAAYLRENPNEPGRPPPGGNADDRLRGLVETPNSKPPSHP